MLLRLRIVVFFFTVAAIALLTRLFYWQIIRGGELSLQARAQYLGREQLPARRGSILASDGSWLSASVDAWLLYAMIPEIEDARRVANQLALFLFEEEKEEGTLMEEAMRIEGQLERDDVVWVPIERKLDGATKNNIDALGLKGIGFEREEMRVYPEGSSSAQILGFLGKDEEGRNRGYFGLEGFYDMTLEGSSGYVEREANALGVPLLSRRSKRRDALVGVDLVTHVNRSMQLLVEQELKEGIERYGARAGTAVVMDPKNGGIMAMASFPSYDPAEYVKYGDEYFKNPVISDSFEPGSVFKPIVMASALDAGAVEPDSKCDICDGPYKIDKYEIKTWDNKYYPDSTMTEVLMHSDNVGMVFVGNRLGKDKFYDYLEKFGFGEVTGIDLQGEFSPRLRDKGEWSGVDVATASFGQGIAVTPIQLVRAISVIANGGLSMKPQVVDKLILDDWEEDIESEKGERVISEKAAKRIAEMMVMAAKKGEAQWTALTGFEVAGKTGTAQIPVAGHYDDEKTIASFVGFAPASDPRFVMLVTLREPQSSPWASETAAPLWFRIAQGIFPILGIQPER